LRASLAIALGLALVVPCAAARAEPPLTRALVIGTDRGLSDDPPLSFAASDARKLARALVEIGAVPGSGVTLVAGAGAAEVEAAIAELARSLGPTDRVLVFLSSHGSQDGLHLAGEVLGWSRLRRALQALPARAVVALVDACRSGLLLTAKGFLVAPPLALELIPLGPQGRILITSSGPDELSHESLLIQGSPFAQALISGLRGAADSDHDGRVDGEELYRFLHRRTLVATLGAVVGAQHAEREVALSGAGALVLSELGQTARVVRRAAGGGRAALAPLRDRTCYVLDREKTEVLAELAAGEEGPIALRAGTIVVACPGRDRLLASAPIALAEGAELELADLDFEASEPTYALAKGPSAAGLARAALAGGLWLDPDGRARAALALRLRGGSRAFAYGANLALAPESSRALVTGGVGYALPWWDAFGTRLELGIAAGAAAAVAGQDRSVLLGQYVEVLGPGPLLLSARVDLALAYPVGGRTLGRGPGVLGLFSLGVGLESQP
jgi:hypothetical protein